ncbi:MAG: AraC family transcriptional regulator [Firmicutes bacterium]|nr:AraC family transcriptional regulator [Bacillota bacterium]
MNDIRLYEDISELGQSFPIKIRKYSSTHLMPHWHEHIELLYIIFGEGRFVCNSKTADAYAGETVVVNSSELHSFIAEKSIEYICLIINTSMFSDVNCGNIIINSKIPHDEFVTNCFKHMYEEFLKGEAASNMVIKGETYLLMAHLIRNYTAMHLSRFEYDVRMARMKKVNMILDYIHANYSQPISTSKLAKKWYLSESHMCRMFKAATGVKLTEYINKYRVDKAATLLLNSDDSVSDIASKVGFDNLNYFDRIFKRYKKLSPKKYKKQ